VFGRWPVRYDEEDKQSVTKTENLSYISMTIEQIRNFYNAQPFQAFVIHLADGRAIPVPSREFMMTSPTGRTIGVFQPDGTANIIDLLLVTDLETKPASNGARRRKR
jgi:hypothetical protein